MISADLLGLAEVRELTGLTDDGIRYHDERLQPIRISGRRVYSRDVVLAFLAERAEARAARASSRTER